MVEHSEFEGLVERMLEAHLPAAGKLISVERLSGGASQETYRIVAEASGVERKLALRRAAGGAVLTPATSPGLATEARLMQAARGVGVPEPEVYHVLEEDDALGAGFLMEWIEGEALGAKIVRAPEFEDIRPKLAFQCGEILGRIHSIDLDASGLRESLAAVTPEQYIHTTWAGYKSFSTPQPMIDYTGRWLLDHIPSDIEMCLVHNDFRNGNFMLSPSGITAVLDWELAHIGDPMRDLGWLCTNSWRFGAREKPVGGFGEREDLFRGYESVTGRPVDPDRVKFWEVFGSFWWSTVCLAMAEHFRSGPDKSVERPAIGRRTSEGQVDCVNLLLPGPAALVEGDEGASALEMPRADELLSSVRDFLRADVMEGTAGRLRFLARVASNSLDIVLRETLLGPALHGLETSRLQALFGCEDDRVALRWRLVNELRDGTMSLEHPGLADYLRDAVVNQAAIDQPKYSGYRAAVREK